MKSKIQFAYFTSPWKIAIANPKGLPRQQSKEKALVNLSVGIWHTSLVT